MIVINKVCKYYDGGRCPYDKHEDFIDIHDRHTYIPIRYNPCPQDCLRDDNGNPCCFIIYR